MTEIQNINVSNKTIGDVIPILCQVATCLPDAIVSIYKGDQVVFTSQSTQSFVNSVTFVYNHVVEANSAGQYACRGFTTQGSSQLQYFNITGELLYFLLIRVCMRHAKWMEVTIHWVTLLPATCCLLCEVVD